MKTIIALILCTSIYLSIHAQSIEFKIGVVNDKKVLFRDTAPFMGSKEQILLIDTAKGRDMRSSSRQFKNDNMVALVTLVPMWKCECFSVFRKNSEGYWELISENKEIPIQMDFKD